MYSLWHIGESSEAAASDNESSFSGSVNKTIKDKKDDYFTIFITELTNVFKNDEQFIKDRGSVIIR